MTRLIKTDGKIFFGIVNCGLASKVTKEIVKMDIGNCTTFLGSGSANNDLLHFLGIDEVRKEIIMVLANSENDERLHRLVEEKFKFNKPNTGIAFSVPIESVLLKKDINIEEIQPKGREKMDYKAIFTIVERGLGDDVISAAESVGAMGATVVHGRGSGSHDKASIFNLVVEPEKEIVLILAKDVEVDKIVKSIDDEIDISSPGKGIIFVLDVDRTTGLLDYSKYEEAKDSK